MLAGIQRLRNLRCQYLCMRYQEIGQAAFAGARGAQHQGLFPLQQRHQRVHRGLPRVVLGFGFDGQRQHLVAHGAVGGQLGPGSTKGLGQVAFVQRDHRAYARGLGGDERTRELVFRELRLGSHEDEHLVQVGRKGLGAQFVLAVKQVVAWLDFFNRTFVF